MPKIYFFNYYSLGYSIGTIVEARCMQRKSESEETSGWKTISGLILRGTLKYRDGRYCLTNALVLKDGDILGRPKKDIPLEPQNFPRQHIWRYERDDSGNIDQDLPLEVLVG
ncbi:hypothetical protein HYS31_03070 [Candidatus Woesearchaeota archaeon]|nr:hypothetical protein [Candidatus Woesearchaeota archaeon]